MMTKGLDYHGYGADIFFSRNRKVLFQGRLGTTNLLELQGEAILDSCANIAYPVESLEVWHRRFGHISAPRIFRLVDEGLVSGINLHTQSMDVCKGCLSGKQHREPFPKLATFCSTCKLGLIHSDVCGKMPVESLGGARLLRHIY